MLCLRTSPEVLDNEKKNISAHPQWRIVYGPLANNNYSKIHVKASNCPVISDNDHFWKVYIIYNKTQNFAINITSNILT